MAYREHINKNGSFELSEKGTLIKCFDEVAAGTVEPQANPTELTDNSTGSASNTIAAMTGVDGTGSNAAPLTATKNAIASLAAKLTAVQEALKAAGVLT